MVVMEGGGVGKMAKKYNNRYLRRHLHKMQTTHPIHYECTIVHLKCSLCLQLLFALDLGESRCNCHKLVYLESCT